MNDLQSDTQMAMEMQINVDSGGAQDGTAVFPETLAPTDECAWRHNPEHHHHHQQHIFFLYSLFTLFSLRRNRNFNK
jgi:hypothetical protein